MSEITRQEQTTATGMREVWLSIDHGFQSRHGRVGSVALALHRTRDDAGKPTDAWYLSVGFARDGGLYRGWRYQGWFPTQAEAEAAALRLFAEHAVIAARSAQRIGSSFK
jgi:hypothetical protein